MPDENNVIVAGAGMAGLLGLLRLSQQQPDWTFTLIEREPWIGGRMRSTRDDEGSWSCGLQAVSASLLDFIVSEAALDSDMVAKHIRPLQKTAVLIGQKMQTLPYSDITAPEMAKAIAGSAAVREWPKLEELLQKHEAGKVDLDQTVAQAWPGDKKSAALVPLEQLGHLWGLPELGSSSVRIFLRQLLEARRGLWTGRWDRLFEDSLARLRAEGRLHIECGAQIMAGRYEDKQWILATTKGTFQSKKLLVAQSPWEAVLWLGKDFWPSRLLNIASKTKPTSVVILSEKCKNHGLADISFVVAEDVQVIAREGQICYQTPINYELTVQSPAVTKAVKRLKRAKKKLELVYPDLQIEGDGHLALLPVGWTHAVHPPEQKWFEKLDASHVQKPHLAFAGDAIGGENDADQNLLRSVQDACVALTSK